MILDAGTGAITDVNPFLIDMLGYSHDEFMNRKLWEVGAFKDIQASRDAFQTLQNEKYIRYEDLPLKAKDGHLVQVEFWIRVRWIDRRIFREVLRGAGRGGLWLHCKRTSCSSSADIGEVKLRGGRRDDVESPGGAGAR